MKNYALIKELIGSLQKIENKREEDVLITIDDFTDYLVARREQRRADEGKSQTADLKKSVKQPAVTGTDNQQAVSNEISKLFVLIARFIRTMAKRALESTPLQSVEEFSYLAMLKNMDSTTKSDLINQNYQEKTTGGEIIKRLISYDVISQFDDQLDKRSKRVQITENGSQLLKDIFENMGDVSELIIHHLSAAERESLVTVLRKIEIVHRTQQEELRGMSLDQIKEIVKR
jgi:DNA-binding MarR family transcriptional regulator